MDVAIGLLPRHRVREAGLLLAVAFAEDGILSRFLPGERGRLAVPAFFEAVLLGHLPTTYAATAGQELVGIAVWAPPDGAAPAALRERLRARLLTLEVQALFPRSSRRLLAGLRALESRHPREPHWHLVFAGVDPGRRGAGIGEALLRPVLRESDRDGTTCYLETPFPRTHAFYRRLGFEHALEVRPFPGAPPLVTMIRRPHVVTRPPD